MQGKRPLGRSRTFDGLRLDGTTLDVRNCCICNRQEDAQPPSGEHHGKRYLDVKPAHQFEFEDRQGHRIFRNSNACQYRTTLLKQKNPFGIAATNQEEGYYEPVPPPGWPFNNSIQLSHVSHKHSEFNVLSVNDMSLQIAPLEKVSLYDEAGGTTIETLFMLLTKLKHLKA